MTIIVCVDNKFGMLFNNRRLSQDKNFTNYIINMANNNKVWANEYSKVLLGKEPNNIIIDNDFASKADINDFVFIENIKPSILEDKTDKIILCKWNRDYPAEEYFDIDLENWKLEQTEEIKGYSHEKITIETYRRKR